MKRQAWWCEGCGARGYVDYEPHADAWSVFTAILRDHHQRSPECNQADEIRVQNEAWVKQQ